MHCVNLVLLMITIFENKTKYILDYIFTLFLRNGVLYIYVYIYIQIVNIYQER